MDMRRWVVISASGQVGMNGEHNGQRDRTRMKDGSAAAAALYKMCF